MISRRAAAVVLAAALGVLAGEARAQCPMCGQAAENAGTRAQVTRTFGLAVGILLVPVTGLLGGTGYLLWRFRGGGSPPPAAGSRRGGGAVPLRRRG